MKWKEEKSNKWHANIGGIECVFIKEKDFIYVITIYLEGAGK